MRQRDVRTIEIGSRRLEYRLARSSHARKLRVRVDPSGVEVIQPSDSGERDVIEFLMANEGWLFSHIDRMCQLASLRKTSLRENQILFRGNATGLAIETVSTPARQNRVKHQEGALLVEIGRASPTSPLTTLENWLRKQARNEIEKQVRLIATKLRVTPGRLYVMDQRTKWGNCSSRGNLSFSWRLIMAPDSVLQYLVAHEAVHLAVPNHSREFWLTLQSVYPEMKLARDWLSTNVDRLKINLEKVLQAALL